MEKIVTKVFDEKQLQKKLSELRKENCHVVDIMRNESDNSYVITYTKGLLTEG